VWVDFFVTGIPTRGVAFPFRSQERERKMGSRSQEWERKTGSRSQERERGMGSRSQERRTHNNII
jgi:hypothetical protein